MSRVASEGSRAAEGFEAALEGRMAADRRALGRETAVLVLLCMAFWIGWRCWSRAIDAWWPLARVEWITLVVLVAAAPVLQTMARWIPSRARRVLGLDRELRASGALVAADEIDPHAQAPLGALLRRRCARALAAPLSSAARSDRKAARRRRLLRLACLALLLWFLLQLLGALLGPQGMMSRGSAGDASGASLGTARQGGTTGGPALARAREEERADAASDESTTSAESESETPQPREGPIDPPPPAPEQRLEDFFVRLKEQTNAGEQRELWVLPTQPGDGSGGEQSASGERADASAGAATRERLASAGIEELRRAPERATLPATLSERERRVVEAYFEALRKLP